jgi:hypothetical protein
MAIALLLAQSTLKHEASSSSIRSMGCGNLTESENELRTTVKNCLRTEYRERPRITRFDVVRIWDDENGERTIFKYATKKAKFPDLIFLTFLYQILAWL